MALCSVLVFTAPAAAALGGSQTTSIIFKSWCLKLFTNMFAEFTTNPLGGIGGVTITAAPSGASGATGVVQIVYPLYFFRIPMTSSFFSTLP